MLPHPTKVATVLLTGRQVLQVLEQSVTEVVEARLKRRGAVRAPQLGNVTLVKARDGQ